MMMIVIVNINRIICGFGGAKNSMKQGEVGMVFLYIPPPIFNQRERSRTLGRRATMYGVRGDTMAHFSRDLV